MNEFENELDKLRWLLDEANIPYQSYKEELSDKLIEMNSEYYSGNYRYYCNQIIYGIDPDDVHKWKLDGVCQMGSYGARQGLIETYGPLGTDAEGDPLVLNADDVFFLIKEDWLMSQEGKEK